jgi:hypothetical protein
MFARLNTPREAYNSKLGATLNEIGVYDVQVAAVTPTQAA